MADINFILKTPTQCTPNLRGAFSDYADFLGNKDGEMSEVEYTRALQKCSKNGKSQPTWGEVKQKAEELKNALQTTGDKTKNSKEMVQFFQYREQQLNALSAKLTNTATDKRGNSSYELSRQSFLADMDQTAKDLLNEVLAVTCPQNEVVPEFKRPAY